MSVYYYRVCARVRDCIFAVGPFIKVCTRARLCLCRSTRVSLIAIFAARTQRALRIGFARHYCFIDRRSQHIIVTRYRFRTRPWVYIIYSCCHPATDFRFAFCFSGSFSSRFCVVFRYFCPHAFRSHIIIYIQLLYCIGALTGSRKSVYDPIRRRGPQTWRTEPPPPSVGRTVDVVECHLLCLVSTQSLLYNITIVMLIYILHCIVIIAMRDGKALFAENRSLGRSILQYNSTRILYRSK